MWFQSLFVRQRPSSSSVLQKRAPHCGGWLVLYFSSQKGTFVRTPLFNSPPLPLTTAAAAAEVTLNLFAFFVPWMNDVQWRHVPTIERRGKSQEIRFFKN